MRLCVCVRAWITHHASIICYITCLVGCFRRCERQAHHQQGMPQVGGIASRILQQACHPRTPRGVMFLDEILCTPFNTAHGHQTFRSLGFHLPGKNHLMVPGCLRWKTERPGCLVVKTNSYSHEFAKGPSTRFFVQSELMSTQTCEEAGGSFHEVEFLPVGVLFSLFLTGIRKWIGKLLRLCSTWSQFS